MERFQLRRSNSSPFSPLHSHNLSREGNCFCNFKLRNVEVVVFFHSSPTLFSASKQSLFLIFFPLLAFFIFVFRNKSNAKENQSVFTFFFLRFCRQLS